MSPLPQPLIVAVDDDPDDLYVLRHLLGKTGASHTFQPFSNGEAAVVGLSAMIQEQERRVLPLICFLDIKMAAMNGFELLRWIRGQDGFKNMPAVMFSSSDDPRDIDLARELGAQAYLKKYPSLSAMQAVMEEARGFAALPEPRNTFLHWNYRFVEKDELAAAK